MKKIIAILFITIQFSLALNTAFGCIYCGEKSCSGSSGVAACGCPYCSGQIADVTLSRHIEGDFVKFVRLTTDDTYSGTADSQTRPYGDFLWPINIPVVHPYKPTFDLRDDAASPVLTKIPEFTLTAKLSSIDIKDVPSKAIQNELEKFKITRIECFMVFQNNPWVAKTDILFRPQPWLHTNAKVSNKADYASPISAYQAPIGEQFKALVVFNGKVSTHHQGTFMVFSGKTPSIGSIDFNTTTGFYTICIETSQTPRAAITLHVLYGDADHDKIRPMIEGLKVNQLSLTALFDELDKLKIDTKNLRDFAQGKINAKAD
jgi:hypothetical protein